ncbi:MAG: ATPase [Oscillospiraceae bacterium]|nr:ATPase [Oscillospiraceae bacterium]
MKMIKIVGHNMHLDDVIEVCADSECYHPETSESMLIVNGYKHVNETNPYNNSFVKLKEIFNILNIEPEIIETNLKDKIFDLDEISRYIDEIKTSILELREKKTKLIGEIEHIEISLEQFEHFRGLNIELDKLFQSEFIKVRFGRMPAQSYTELAGYEDNPNVMFFPWSNDANYYWGMYVAPNHCGEEIDRLFASLFFVRILIPSSSTTPEHAIELLDEQYAETKIQLNELEKSMADIIEREIQKCIILYSKIKWKYDIFELRKYSVKNKNSFMQIGWIPENETNNIADKLDGIKGIEYSIVNPNQMINKASPPTKLKNPKIFRAFEYYVEMYGLPGYKEVDPTIFVAITYTIFFGIMFADLGQGIILSIAGWLMYKLKGMELGKILVPCGISGAVFGTIFGSFFGSETAINDFERLVGFQFESINVMNSAMALLILSIVFGMILIVFAMLINVCSLIRQKQTGKAIFSPSGVCGMLVYIAIIAAIVTNTPIILIFTVIPLLCLFLSVPFVNLIDNKDGWKVEKWSDYFLESFFELFETILSYATNTVSFMRIGAFALVHAGMMLVFFSLAELVGGRLPGAIIIIFGNILVVVLEGLLVGVQALRLEFYEMFSRFFEGNGRIFSPINLKKR